ncbi:MAG: hypothetical protein RR705_06680 [Lachnospiraceae bacterium]
MTDMGLGGENENCHIEDLEKYIFLYGNEQEIYGYEERSFIECVGSVYIYNAMNRKTNKGVIATKIFAADISQFEDCVKNCFFLMKVINKANDGFNIFLLKTMDGFFLGCRIYDKDDVRNCTLTKAIKNEKEYEELAERLLYLPDTDEFIPFYNAIVEVIDINKMEFLDYDLNVSIRRGISSGYLDMLSDMENLFHLSMEYARELYYKTLEPNLKLSVAEEYRDVMSSLEFIKSQKVNTLEMLFDADELLLMSDKIEQETEKTLNSENEKLDGENTDSELIQYIDDPEKIVRLLKEKEKGKVT